MHSALIFTRGFLFLNLATSLQLPFTIASQLVIAILAPPLLTILGLSRLIS